MYCIYRIINLINGKTYIGQHKYKTLDDYYMGSGKHLKAAQAKYGIDNFKKEILVFNISKKEYADLLEKTFIASEREKVGIENCYNLADGGQGNTGPRSEETRKKISEALRGERNPWYGKCLSEETRKKMSEARRGKSAYWKGKHLSEETKRKIGDASKGRHFSEEAKIKISEVSKGKHWFNNGEKSIRAKECPEGFVPGRLKMR